MSFYRSIFDKGATIRIIELQSFPPHVDNCYKILLSRNDKKSGLVEEELNYVPRSQVDLAIHLKVSSCRLNKSAIDYMEKMWDSAPDFIKK